MPELTPQQLRTRERVEDLIGLMAPVLDLVLATGDRISRMVEPEDYEYYPVRSRSGEESEAAAKAERSRAGSEPPAGPAADGDQEHP